MRQQQWFWSISLLLLFGCGNAEVTPVKEDPLRPVRFQEIGYATQAGAHAYSGVAQADQLSKLSFRVGGTISSLRVKLGDRVRKGQLIATIDPADYSIQAEQANASTKGAVANLEAAETQLINSKATYQRLEKLYENNSVPLSDFEQAKAAFESAEASYAAAATQVTSAEKQLQSARNQVSYTRLVAPFTGVITAVHTEINELVGSGTPVAELSSTAKPEVRIGIPENFISNIKQGETVDIEFSVLSGKVFSGKVSEISFATGGAPTYPAIITIDSPSTSIRPGMAATVTFREKAGNMATLTCPVKALGKDTENTFVFLLEKESEEAYRVRRKPVEVGELLPDGFAVKSGLEEGQLVATAGLKSLLDGMQVQLMTRN
ncbi:MAG: efflux RND transporter periplasmic adaptor subunit [Bacteroidota bacterium]